MKTRSKQLLHTITYDVVSLTLRVFSRHVDRPLSTQKKSAFSRIYITKQDYDDARGTPTRASSSPTQKRRPFFLVRFFFFLLLFSMSFLFREHRRRRRRFQSADNQRSHRRLFHLSPRTPFERARPVEGRFHQRRDLSASNARAADGIQQAREFARLVSEAKSEEKRGRDCRFDWEYSPRERDIT